MLKEVIELQATILQKIPAATRVAIFADMMESPGTLIIEVYARIKDRAAHYQQLIRGIEIVSLPEAVIVDRFCYTANAAFRKQGGEPG